MAHAFHAETKSSSEAPAGTLKPDRELMINIALGIMRKISANSFNFIKQFIELKIALFNIVFLCITSGAFSQTFPDIKSSRLTESDGLSSNSVTSVAQDGMRIIWAGTDNGLNRCDGYGFAKFYTDPYDTNSISTNGIQSINSDLT